MATSKNKTSSPLAQAVLALDEHFSELNRLGARIDDITLRTEADGEQAQRLMVHFTESAQAVSDGVMALSQALNEARATAEASAQKVAARAEELQNFQEARQKKMEIFRQLGEKVQALNNSLVDLKRSDDDTITEADREQIAQRFSQVESQLQPLIEEARSLKTEAQTAKMTDLEESAHALQQRLQSLSQKLGSLQQSASTLQ